MDRITKLWEAGTPHDPRSEAIYKGIAKIDFEECSDSFGFKSGGDGDNGETLMYLLDLYFEDEDKKLPPSDLRIPFKIRDDIEDVEIRLQDPVGPITFYNIVTRPTSVASLSNPSCAPLEERCGARAVVWRLDVPWHGPPRLCACCSAIWTQHGLSNLYGPVPTERIALIGCDAKVKR